VLVLIALELCFLVISICLLEIGLTVLLYTYNDKAQCLLERWSSIGWSLGSVGKLDCDIFANLIGIIIKGGIGLALVGVVEQRVL